MIKICAYCKNTDGILYTSLPPMIRCELTGEFKDLGEVCDYFDVEGDEE